MHIHTINNTFIVYSYCIPLGNSYLLANRLATGWTRTVLGDTPGPPAVSFGLFRLDTEVSTARNLFLQDLQMK